MKARTLTRLVQVLQLAHAGELAAAIAYAGHAASVRDLVERAEISGIMSEELDHRARVRTMLDVLDVPSDERRERRMRRIGRLVAAFCRIGGWYAPMYGAGRFERNNVGEYDRAARCAADAGYPQFVADLLDMARVEREHERYFRTKSAGHWLWRVSPKWSPPSAVTSLSPVRHQGDELVEQLVS
jgi:rubrerythrin